MKYLLPTQQTMNCDIEKAVKGKELLIYYLPIISPEYVKIFSYRKIITSNFLKLG